MSSLRTTFAALTLAVSAVVVPATSNAQEASQPLSAERSRQIVSDLAAIEADKATFVNNLFAQWSPFVDNQAYDIWNELGETAMRAPAWQLRGAAMAGNFETMAGILKGIIGAGEYNQLAEAQPKSAIGPLWTAPEKDAFGDNTDQLVFVPIAPCRVVDTRGASGVRVGIIAAGTSRAFDLEDDAFTAGQGVSGPCTGLPVDSPAAWAVNITAVGYSGGGWLTAWPANGTEPNASILNYAAGSGGAALANGVILTGYYLGTDDIIIKASASATHVIIDVTGYFRSAGVTSAAITRVAGTTSALAAGTRAFFSGGACPAGTRLIGGEVDHNGSDIAMGESRQNSSTVWTFWMINNSGSSSNVTAYSRCMDTPLKLQ